MIIYHRFDHVVVVHCTWVVTCQMHLQFNLLNNTHFAWEYSKINSWINKKIHKTEPVEPVFFLTAKLVPGPSKLLWSST